MKGIKRRLVGRFMIVIFASIFMIEFLLISFIKHYYYNNVEEMLSNQIKISADFYENYFSGTSLEDNILDNVDVFWKRTNAEVQIIDLKGNIIMDSIGISLKNKIDTPDFKKALKGERGKWVGNVSYDTSNVMAVAYPLKSDNRVIGVLRFITSLKKINKSIFLMSSLFILIGCVVVIIVGLVSIFLADTIVKPIEKLTCNAEKMAKGNFSIRNKKIFDDEVGKLSDTLNYMAEEIQKRDKLKNEFISSVSHELRTPLTAIKGWAITLNDNEYDDKEILKDGLNIIEKESERLTIMVEELLDFSKFISGKVSLKKKDVQVESLIEYINKHMQPHADRNKIKFIVKYEKHTPKVSMDENRIKQVLINILDNAFKFTNENGEVILSLTYDKNYIIMKVIDNGCGISKEDLPKIKEKFYKGKSSKSKNGIGLSISDEIVKMHNGTLNIKSEINKGTEVEIKIPIKK